MALPPIHRDDAGQRSPPPDLDRVTHAVRIGRLADNGGVKAFALVFRPVEQFRGAVDRRTFLVSGDQQRDRSGQGDAVVLQAGKCGNETGNAAFHVHRAAAEHLAVFNGGREGRMPPAALVARWYDIGMTGEHQVLAWRAAHGKQVVHIRRARFGEGHGMVFKPQSGQHRTEAMQGSGIFGCHRRACNQRTKHCGRVGQAGGHLCHDGRAIPNRLRCHAR